MVTTPGPSGPVWVGSYPDELRRGPIRPVPVIVGHACCGGWPGHRKPHVLPSTAKPAGRGAPEALKPVKVAVVAQVRLRDVVEPALSLSEAMQTELEPIPAERLEPQPRRQSPSRSPAARAARYLAKKAREAALG
jgi:hypothetical protein